MCRRTSPALLALSVAAALIGCGAARTPAAEETPAASAARTTPAPSAAQPDPQNAIYTLDLDSALPGDRPLTVHLAVENGAAGRGFALAFRFNRASHLVDASGLKVAGARLRGTLKVTIRPDHWVPADKKPVACTYDLDAAVKGGEVAGTFRGRCGDAEVGGAVSGRLEPPAPLPETAILRLEFYHPFEERPRGGHLAAAFVLRGGKVRAGEFLVIPSSPTHYGSYGRMEKHDIQVAGHAIRGTFTAGETRGGSGDVQTYACTVDGLALGGTVAGTLAIDLDGRAAPAVPFWGTVLPAEAPPLGEARYMLLLHAAVPQAHMLEISLDTRGGRFGRGFAVTTVNRAACDVDASALRLEGGRLRGRIDVTINVDDWVPTDRKPIVCTYDLDAEVADLLVRGTYKGRAGGADASGAVTGRVEPPSAVPPPWTVWLKLTKRIEGLIGGWVALGLTVRADGTEVTRFPIPAALRKADFRLDGDAFLGTIEATVSKGPYEGKALTLVFEGKIIGDRAAGDFDVRIDGRSVSREKFFATVGPAAPQAPAAPQPGT